jgi:hypothetical protein
LKALVVLQPSRSTLYIILMSKELIGTACFATASHLTLQIPVAESFLPVKSNTCATQQPRAAITTFPRSSSTAGTRGTHISR